MSQIALTKTQRRQVEAMVDVLKPWGLTWSLVKDGKHLQMKVSGDGQRIRGEYKLTIAGTPQNDDHAETYARQAARRLVNEIMRRAGVL